MEDFFRKLDADESRADCCYFGVTQIYGNIIKHTSVNGVRATVYMFRENLGSSEASRSVLILGPGRSNTWASQSHIVSIGSRSDQVTL